MFKLDLEKAEELEIELPISGGSSKKQEFQKKHLLLLYWLRMWELDCKESWTLKIWTLKIWCFWTVLLKKMLESPLDCKEIKPAKHKANQSWMYIGRTDAEAGTPIFWPPHMKNWLIGKEPNAGKDWRQEEKGLTENEMIGWHHWLDGQGFEQTPRVGDGRGGLVCWCCTPWCAKSWIQLSGWTELNWKPLTVWMTKIDGKFFKRWEYQTILPASWEICMQVKKQQLELDMEQQIGSR